MTPISCPRPGAASMTAGAGADQTTTVAVLCALSTPGRLVDAGPVDDVTREVCTDDSTAATVTVGFWAGTRWRSLDLCPVCAVWHIEHSDATYVDVEVRLGGFEIGRAA